MMSSYCSQDKMMTMRICSHIRVSNIAFNDAGLPSVYVHFKIEFKINKFLLKSDMKIT